MTLNALDGLGQLRGLSTSVNPLDGAAVGATQLIPTSAPYRASGSFPLAATPTDVFSLSGSASNIVRVRKVVVTGFTNTAGQFVFLLIRRSLANVGGTPTVLPSLPYDGLDAAATAVASYYASNPTTLGTTVGTLRRGRLFFALQTNQNDRLTFEFGALQEKACVLRGASDFLCLNGAGAALPGSSTTLDCEIEWDEDTI